MFGARYLPMVLSDIERAFRVYPHDVLRHRLSEGSQRNE